jgi:REP element-mobilizing transposase RayT
MARRPRTQFPGLLRHVMARGNGRMTIFLDDSDYIRFLDLLMDVVEAFALECWSYCLMPNHYHVAVRPTLANLSDAIQALNGCYAQWWNKRHETVGHVFQGRFKDQIVDREAYLLALCRYIARNPVRAGLVAEPADWRWSSYAATVGLKPLHPSLSVSDVLQQFGDEASETVQTLQTRYATFVMSESTHPCTDERIRSREWILGPREFKSAIKAQLLKQCELPATPPSELPVFDAGAAM